MQPMKPEDVSRILSTRPDVTEADIHEYQRLHGERLASNPHIPKTDAEQAVHDGRDARLKDLHQKLFGTG